VREILDDLNREVGVRGSLLLSSDGMVMVSAVGPELDSEAVAANAAVVLRNVREVLSGWGMGELRRFACNAAFGKLVLAAAGDAYLAVVLDPAIQLDYTMMAVTSAGVRLAQALRI
jgi:predicted regulator of Ras-like GTPase activity (Roadblock/LC7/MglB family)